MGLIDREYMQTGNGARRPLRCDRKRRPRLRDRLLFAMWPLWRWLRGRFFRLNSL